MHYECQCHCMGTLLQYNWFLSNSKVTQFQYMLFYNKPVVSTLNHGSPPLIRLLWTKATPLIKPGFRCIEIVFSNTRHFG